MPICYIVELMLFTKFSEELKHMRSKKKCFLDDLTWNGSMLRDEVRPIISAWYNIEDLISMQDGAPLHFAIVVCEWLNAQFLENG